jgi:hypothetical protein
MPAWPPFLPVTDLAPGDTRTREADWTDLSLHTVTSPDDPLFAFAYEQLAAEFAWRGELETRDTLAQRLAWNPANPIDGSALLYRLQLLFRGETCLGLRDHTAILLPEASEVVVHLSHILVTPAERRSGVAGLLRALPISAARDCAAAAGRTGLPITLLAEMEVFDPSKPDSIARSTAYAKAGFRQLPADLGYLQPDFRTCAEIDADGGPSPLPLSIHLRRLGREAETDLPTAEALAALHAVYTVFGTTFRPSDMTPCWRWLAALKATAPARLPLTLPPGLTLPG